MTEGSWEDLALVNTEEDLLILCFIKSTVYKFSFKLSFPVSHLLCQSIILHNMLLVDRWLPFRTPSDIRPMSGSLFLWLFSCHGVEIFLIMPHLCFYNIYLILWSQLFSYVQFPFIILPILKNELDGDLRVCYFLSVPVLPSYPPVNEI